MIIYHGVSSDDVRVIVEHYPARPVPKRKFERYSIPGRSGDILEYEDAWENVVQPYDIYISAEDPGLPIIAAAAVQWLMVKGYQRLEDEYDPDTFRLAAFVGPVDLQNTLNQFGRATIQFDCMPQRFLKTGAEPLKIAQGDVLANPSIYTAGPLIAVQGEGSGLLSVGNYQLTLDDCNNVILDCGNDEDAYRVEGGAVSNLNTTVHGSFPKLPAGLSAVTWEGGISGVTITPRWYVI